MKLFNRRRFGSSGFGHIELLVVIVIVLVLAGAGYFVYSHNKKTSTAHAGSYNYKQIGVATYTDGTTFTVSACLQTISSNLHRVNAVVDGTGNNPQYPNTFPYSLWFTDFSSKVLNTSNIMSDHYITSWQVIPSVGGFSANAKGNISFSTVNGRNNYIWVSAQAANHGGPYGTTGGFWFRPGNLVKC